MTTPPVRRRLHRAVTKLLILLAVVEIALPVALWLGRNRIIFIPSATPLPETRLDVFARADGRVVHVVRGDGRLLAAYDVAPRGAGDGVPVVLFLHGNAGNIATRAEIALWFAETAGVRVLMPDWSGYGGNEGSPSEDEVNADALAAYDHLVASGVAARRIVVFGESVGGAPALFLATQRPVAGVALQSAFSSLSSMAWRQYPWLPLVPLLVRGAFGSAERIATLDVPVLIVHGTRDSIVPYSEAERLRDAARPGRAEFLPIEGADHNDLFVVAGDGYLRSLGERFRRWTGEAR